MTNKTDIRQFMLPSALIAVAAIVVLSWLLSAMGVPCRSLLTDEGIRWMARHLSMSFTCRLNAEVLCLLTAIGAMIRSGIPTQWRTMRFVRLLLIFILAWAAIIMLVLSPISPLLSLTGTLTHSPFLQALPVLIWLTIIAFAMLFSAHDNKMEVLTFGLRKHPELIYLTVISSFIYYCIKFIIS